MSNVAAPTPEVSELEATGEAPTASSARPVNIQSIVRQQVREHPWTAMLGVAAVGLWIGRSVPRPVAMAGLSRLMASTFQIEIENGKSMAMNLAKDVAREAARESFPQLFRVLASRPAGQR